MLASIKMKLTKDNLNMAERAELMADWSVLERGSLLMFVLLVDLNLTFVSPLSSFVSLKSSLNWSLRALEGRNSSVAECVMATESELDQSGRNVILLQSVQRASLLSFTSFSCFFSCQSVFSRVFPSFLASFVFLNY